MQKPTLGRLQTGKTPHPIDAPNMAFCLSLTAFGTLTASLGAGLLVVRAMGALFGKRLATADHYRVAAVWTLLLSVVGLPIILLITWASRRAGPYRVAAVAAVFWAGLTGVIFFSLYLPSF